MNQNHRIIGILLAAACSLLLAGIVIGNLRKDIEPPEIAFQRENLPAYAKGQDMSVLLADVSAKDENDGDVTANIVVSNIYDFHDGTAKVVYAARDKAGNIAKKERMITYTGSVSEAAVTTSALVTGSGVSTVSAAAVTTKTPAASEALTTTGEAPVIHLSQSQVLINKGGTFKKMDYIQEVVDNADSESELYRRIQISGSYNVNKAGTYELSYSVTDSDGNKSAIEKLTLVVQ